MRARQFAQGCVEALIARSSFYRRCCRAGHGTHLPRVLRADGSDPEYQADDKYPPWLFQLLDEKPMLEDFVMKGLENVPPKDMKAVFRMANKRRIKAENDKRRAE